MLILTYGQSRVFYAMARDGLLPRAFATIHAKFRTPWIGTILLGSLIALASSLLPITILGDLVSLGTAFAFAMVCVSVIWLRKTRPDLKRPFTAPWGMWTPVLGIVFAGIMAAPLIIDIIAKAMNDDPIPAIILGSYLLLGAAIYIFYGYSNSRLGKGLDVLDDTALQGPLEAIAHGVDDRR
jgi:APA family basic amino acid/polyamine antiporter